MFERQDEPLLPVHEFRKRVLGFLLLAFFLTFVWVVVGGIGFYFTAGLSWPDALYNSAMMVSDMGPVFNFTSAPARIFAALYALASGLVFIGAVGLAFAPVIHRLYHYFHLDEGSHGEL
jgi:hypothetical protein